MHFAEQRAAPYSMKSSWHKRYTVNNNVNATHNLLAALVEAELDTHVVHLGTMGVYGYGTAGVKIPEGYLRVRIDTDEGTEVEQEILYPVNPGSVYHMTKTQDQLLFAFYNKNDGTRVTDLHQGIVWGTQTAETRLDERLINRFDYDGDYGTVLNRFLMQAAVGYPLTVHGTGGQTRAFIHIQDTVRCIQLAIENPPERGERVRVFNQMTECHRVRRPGQARRQPDRRRDRLRRQPAQGSRRERAVRREPPAARPGSGADPPAGRPPHRGDRDRPRLRRPLRPDQDPVQLQVDPAQPGARGPGGHRVATPPEAGDRRAAPLIVLNRRAATRPTITGVERWTAEVVRRLLARWPRPLRRHAATSPGAATDPGPVLGAAGAAGAGRPHAGRAGLLPGQPGAARLAPERGGDARRRRPARAGGLLAGVSRLARRLGLACARRALTVITVSEFSRRELIELAGLDPSRLVVIPGGVGERFGPDADPAADGSAPRSAPARTC